MNIDISVANPVGMAQNRDTGIRHDVLDKGVGTARDQQIDRIMVRQQFTDICMTFQQMDPFRRTAGFNRSPVDDILNLPVLGQAALEVTTLAHEA